MSAQFSPIRQYARYARLPLAIDRADDRGVSRSLTILFRRLVHRRRSREMRRAVIGLCALIVCWDLSSRIDELAAGDGAGERQHVAAIVESRSN